MKISHGPWVIIKRRVVKKTKKKKESCFLSAEGLGWEGINQQPSVFAKAKAKCKAKLNGQVRMLMITLGECLDQAIPEAH